jgi:hypothetical protein
MLPNTNYDAGQLGKTLVASGNAMRDCALPPAHWSCSIFVTPESTGSGVGVDVAEPRIA